MSLEFFDKIYYINLDHRLDRKNELLKQFKKLDLNLTNIQRIPAVLDKLNGQRGCAASHIMAIDHAIKNNLKNVLILEDDCEFVQPKTIMNNLIKYFFRSIKEWDVFFLGAQVIESKKTKFNGINQILKAYLTHAYVVNNHYFKVLKKSFEDTYKKLQNELFFSGNFEIGIDRQWTSLQKRDKWYMLDTLLAKQSKSYSDIEKTERDRLISDKKFY